MPSMNGEQLSPPNEALSKISKKSTRATKASIVFLALVIAFSLAASGFALMDRFGDTNARRALQAEFNKNLRNAVIDQCFEIEGLKDGFRNDAQTNYDNLDRNARALGIHLSLEARRIARANLEAKLKKYKRELCPRPKPKG